MSIPSPVIIDISEHQPPSSIDYDKLAKSIDAVIVRVQFGSNYVDNHYKTHIAEFKKRGIPFGVYAWVRGVSKSDMEQEATDFYNRAKDYNPAFWWLDVEEQSMSDMRGGCEAYRVKLRNLGAPKVGVYVANHLFSQFNLNTDFFDGLWIPTYGTNNGQYNGSNPTATSKYNIHQYTSEGRLNGYNGPLDMNRLVSKTFAYFFGGSEPAVAKKIVYQTSPGLYEALKSDCFYLDKELSKKSAWTYMKGQRLFFGEVVKVGKYTRAKIKLNNDIRYCTLRDDYWKLIYNTKETKIK